jgi:hypothetical protein
VAELPVLDAGGALRKLGALPPSAELLYGATLYADMVEPDPSTWQPCDYSSFGSPIRDQTKYSSCTGHAGVAVLDLARRQAGQKPVLLSCTFPYALVNGGRDEGASVSAVLKALTQVGTCTFEECGTDKVLQNQIPKSAWETAKKYRVAEAYLIRSWTELLDAIARGFGTAFGISVGRNFSRLSAEGVTPLPDTVVGGHALAGVGLQKSQRNTWLVKTQNSWGAQWGMKGYCYLTEGHFDNVIDAYAVRYAENIDLPPKVLVAAARPILLPESLTTEPPPLQIEVEYVEDVPADSIVAVSTTPMEPLPSDIPEVESATTDSPSLDLSDVETTEPIGLDDVTPAMIHTDPEAAGKSVAPGRKKSRHKR